MFGRHLLTCTVQNGLDRPRPTQSYKPRRFEGAGSRAHLSKDLAPGSIRTNRNIQRRGPRRCGQTGRENQERALVFSNRVAFVGLLSLLDLYRSFASWCSYILRREIIRLEILGWLCRELVIGHIDGLR